jgi:FAD:protein FMN transferase
MVAPTAVRWGGVRVGDVARRTHEAMGTVMAHRAYGPGAEVALEEVCREIVRLEALLSRFLPGSAVSRVNASAGQRTEAVSAATYAVLEEAVALGSAMPGYFDVTIAPLVALWAQGRAASMPPDRARIRAALRLVGGQGLEMDPRTMRVGLNRVGQAIDLGGIAKGWAGDRVREVMLRHGVRSAYSNLGGNVVTVGTRPDGSSWQIGIQHPRQAEGLLGAVGVVDRAVVTSGDYQRTFVDATGRWHHHILDPSTGYPAASGLISVTVVAERAVVADALSTALFVAGAARARHLLRRCPGAEAILVTSNLRVFVTQGLGLHERGAQHLGGTPKAHFRAAEGVDVFMMDRIGEKEM